MVLLTMRRTGGSLSAALLAALFAVPVWVAPAHAAPASGPSRVLTGADLFNLEVASDPQISPDGRTIVYVRRANDIMTDRTRASIWSIDVASGEQTPLIDGPGSHSAHEAKLDELPRKQCPFMIGEDDSHIPGPGRGAQPHVEQIQLPLMGISCAIHNSKKWRFGYVGVTTV